jgi:hypothetical protein
MPVRSAKTIYVRFDLNDYPKNSLSAQLKQIGLRALPDSLDNFTPASSFHSMWAAITPLS